MTEVSEVYIIDICRKLLEVAAMPRPQRCRRVCAFPDHRSFIPEGEGRGEEVTLTLDEFEVIRLVDLEGFTHSRCAERMEISRTTVTEVYESARRKIARCIVEGRRLTISGGNYRICDGSAGCGASCRHRHTVTTEKGMSTMRIAVTYENEMIFQHFGHTAQFKIYDVKDGAVAAAIVVDTMGSGHGALAGFLGAYKVDTLICGGIGGGAQMALGEAGIRIYGGVSGSADEAVAALLAGTLDYNPDVRCSHHDHEHGEEGHTCGDHGCGSHSCGNH